MRSDWPRGGSINLGAAPNLKIPMEIRPVIMVRDRKTGNKGRYRMDQERVLIGRDRNCFLVLDDRTVSRHHAEIIRDGGSFFLKDLGSGNKTFLNEVPLPAEEKTLLKSGDAVRIGDHELRFELPGRDEATDIFEQTDSDILEIRMLKKMVRALDQGTAPSLEILEGPDLGRRFVLEGKSQEVTIGRDSSCEFQIDSDVISRKHARVFRKWDAVEIEDLDSRNGVYVGKEKIRKSILKDGDRIHLGTIILIFRNPQEIAIERTPKKKPPEPRIKPSFEKKIAEPEFFPEVVPEKIRWNFSPLEILMALLGMIVLAGALWGIIKIL